MFPRRPEKHELYVNKKLRKWVMNRNGVRIFTSTLFFAFCLVIIVVFFLANIRAVFTVTVECTAVLKSFADLLTAFYSDC